MKTQIISPVDPSWTQVLQQCLHDVYQLPQYVELEAKRNGAIAEAILVAQDEKLLLIPYLLRPIEGDSINHEFQDVFDIVSPYGYPGVVLSEAAATSPEFIHAAFDQLISAWRDKQICSAFLRLNPIFNQLLIACLAPEVCHHTGDTVAIDLTLSEEEIWHQTRSDHRKDINRCQREGWIAKTVSLKEYISEFNSIYEEAMDRVGANQSYFFGESFFAELAAIEKHFHLCVIEYERQIVSAGIFTECCGTVHSYLTGTRTAFLKRSPDKLMIHTMRLWAKQRGDQVMHLGGGFGGTRDRLFDYKAGFSQKRLNFHTLRLIIDSEKYVSLVHARAKQIETELKALQQSNYFPAYRVPKTA